MDGIYLMVLKKREVKFMCRTTLTYLVAFIHSFSNLPFCGWLRTRVEKGLIVNTIHAFGHIQKCILKETDSVERRKIHQPEEMV